jgi:hypothetical protein
LPVLLASSAAAAEPIFDNGFEADAGPQCTDKSVRVLAGRRLGFSFPNRDGVVADQWVESACLRLTGIESSLTFDADRGAEVSVNEAAFRLPPVILAEGDRVRLRLRSPATADQSRTSVIRLDGDARGDFSVRSANDGRAAQLFRVGPGQPHRELDEIAGQLVAGDVIELQPGVLYAPVEFRRAGLPQAPIIVRAASGPGPRPAIVGGAVTLSFRGAHHYRLIGVEVRGGSEVCVRHEANDGVIERSRIHDCARHGVLGADLNSGGLRITASEVHDAGGQPPGENLKHPIYVATDRDRYPGAVLRVERSFLHDFGGNGIKSRAERVELYQNWIEAGTGGIYSIELNGYEEYLSEPGLLADVFGNVLIHRHVYGMRMGGDGTGALRGRVRLAHNTLLQGAAFTEYTPVLRFFGELDAVSVRNNVFARLDDANVGEPLRLLRDDALWPSGGRRLEGSANWAPLGSDAIASGYLPPEWTETTLANPPGYLSTLADALDFRLVDGASVAAVAPASGSADGIYSLPDSLQHWHFLMPVQRPVSGSEMAASWLPGSGELPPRIGAH